LLASVVVVVLGAVGYQGQLEWRRQKALAATRVFLSQGDYEHAALSLRHALELGPATAEDCRQAAEMCERGGSREAIFWRQRAANLGGHGVRDECLLARTALRFEDVPLAEITLRALKVGAQQSADYHQAAGELAWALDKKDEAAAHWSEMVRLEPANREYRLASAKAALLSPDSRRANEARDELEGLRADPELQIQALRLLIEDARRTRRDSAKVSLSPSPAASPKGDTRRLIDLLQQLTRSSRIEFADEFLALDVLRELKRPEFPAFLGNLQRASAERPEAIGKIISWMSGNDLAFEALTWLKSLSPRISAEPPVSFAVAEALIARKDWKALQIHVAAADWPQQRDIVPLIRARLWREQGYYGKMFGVERVIEATGRDPSRLWALAQFSMRWGWRVESEKLLWAIVDSPSAQEGALLHLQRIYTEDNDSNGLYRVAKAQCQLHPRDDKARSDLALLSLITGQDDVEADGGRARIGERDQEGIDP
jgi:tetratricopeptide (TPR) repeat protein